MSLSEYVLLAGSSLFVIVNPLAPEANWIPIVGVAPSCGRTVIALLVPDHVP